MHRNEEFLKSESHKLLGSKNDKYFSLFICTIKDALSKGLHLFTDDTGKV